MASSNKILALDDWGLSPGVNEGILELAKLGLVRTVSILPNSKHADYLLEELKRTGAGLSFHLNFTLGKPLVEGASSLTNSRGEFRGFSGFMCHFFTGKINRNDLAREAIAQATFLAETLGVPPALLEAHHNLHLVPGVFSQIREPLWAMGYRFVRTIANRDHWFAYAASKRLLLGDWQAAPVYYPPHRAFENAVELEKYLSARPSHLPFVAHPALVDDLAKTGIEDSLTSRRRQFDLIVAQLARSGS